MPSFQAIKVLLRRAAFKRNSNLPAKGKVIDEINICWLSGKRFVPLLSETYANDRRLDTGRLYRYGLKQNAFHARFGRAEWQIKLHNERSIFRESGGCLEEERRVWIWLFAEEAVVVIWKRKAKGLSKNR